MASIQKHGKKWRVQVYVNGARDSHVATTRAEAAQWALAREGELSGRKLPDRTFADAMKRYATDVAPTHRGQKWEEVRLKALQKDNIAKRKLAGLAGSDFADWRLLPSPFMETYPIKRAGNGDECTKRAGAET